MSPVVVHGPTFLKEVSIPRWEHQSLSVVLTASQYEQFWENPFGTPVMWLGLLYTMMCLATQFQQLSGDEPGEHPKPFRSPQDPHCLVQAYQEKVVQCLILGKYTKSVSYTIETLILYFTIEHFQCKDTQIGPWIILGIIVRIAMRLGYHRDASHFPRISPFHAEMRRRAWAMIVQLDLITSSQIGLPRMVQEWQSDTAEPHNLLDDDFDEDMVNLPTPRPNTDLTPIVYVVTKNRLMSVFGMISDLTTSTQPSLYTEVMRLDRILHEARSAIPPGLQLRPMTKSITDHPDVVMRRIYLALIFHKAQCVLHGKYLVSARSNSQYIYSRQSCIEAALKILEHQSTLHQETQPGGQLHRDRWKVSSLVNHDFLLAVTILCLDLDHDIAETSLSQLSERTVDIWRRDTITCALRESYRIWLQSSGSSREAQKAAEALKIVLEKVGGTGISRLADNGEMSSKFSVMSDDAITVPADTLESTQALSTTVASESLGASNHPSSYGSSLMTLMSDQPSTSILSGTSIPALLGFDEVSGLPNGFDWVRYYLAVSILRES